MNRLRTLVGILLVILGLTGLLGCNRGPQKDAIGSLPDLPEVSSGFTYQAAYTDIAAELLFADGESLLAEKNGQREIYENGKNTEVVGDDIIAFTLWQGSRYYLHEQNNSVFWETPSGTKISLAEDTRGYDPNHIRAQLVFSEKEQYLRYGYQLYVLNEDTAALVGSDIRWVGIGIVNDTVYAVGHAADKKQTEGSGYTALYQIDNGQATPIATLTHGASIVCGGEEGLYILVNDMIYQYQNGQLMSLTQLLPLGIVSNEITGMTAAADGLHLLTEDGFYTLSKCEDTEMVSSEETTADTILRVGYCNDEVGNIQAALAAFAAENPQITLEAETYASHDELLIKIISGDVPDVLWFNGELATLQMLAGKGLLRELSSIAADLNKSDEYYESILECGTFGDELYVLFPAFSVEIFSAPETILPESRKIETCQQFDELFLPYCPNGYGWTTQNIVLNWFLNDSLSEFVDYDTKESNFQQNSFYEMLAFCKKFPVEFEAATADQPFRTISLRSPADIVSEETHYALFSSFDAGVSFSPLPFSSYAGFGVNADSYLAVTRACQNDEAVNALLRFIFCTDTQVEIAQQEFGKIVLNKQANEKLWSDADDSGEWKLACEMLQSILQRVDHLNGCVDYSVIEIIAEESNAYFQADASVQDVASRIDQRVTLYLMEQE